MKWKRKPDPLERILRKVGGDTTCWTFMGALRNGYGAVGIGGQTVYAHRYVYERLVGPVPSGLVIDHLCRNRACVNPTHLEPVSQRENCLRGERAGIRAFACPQGHPYSQENTYTNPQGGRSCRTCKRERQAA